MSKKLDAGELIAMAVKALAGDETVPLTRKGDEWLLRFDAIRFVHSPPMGGMQVIFAWKGQPLQIGTPAKITQVHDHNHLTDQDTVTITGIEGFTKVSFGEKESSDVKEI